MVCSHKGRVSDLNTLTLWLRFSPFSDTLSLMETRTRKTANCAHLPQEPECLGYFRWFRLSSTCSIFTTWSDTYFVFIIPNDPTNPYFQHGRLVIPNFFLFLFFYIPLPSQVSGLPKVIQLGSDRAGIWMCAPVTALLKTQSLERWPKWLQSLYSFHNMVEISGTGEKLQQTNSRPELWVTGVCVLGEKYSFSLFYRWLI